MLRRFAVTIIGVLLLLAGAAMLVLPGPGMVVTVASLAVLATEYVWARRLLVRARDKAIDVQTAAVQSPLRTTGTLVFAAALVALGVAMLVIADVPWPALDSLGDRVWGPVTGGVVVVSGLIVLVSTYLTIRSSRDEPTTYIADPDAPVRARAGGSTIAPRDPRREE